MNEDLKDDLHNLLIVSPSEVDGLLEKLECLSFIKPQNTPASFHFVRFTCEGETREDDLIGKICGLIISFCLKREKYKDNKIDVSNAWQTILEAKSKFVNSDKSGEGGELLTYFLLEGHLGYPKILTKMSLKTSGQMHVHGSDGIHLGLDGNCITLYIGESKLQKDYKTGITEALMSVKEFINPNGDEISKEKFEMYVLDDHIDIPEGNLREKVKAALNPYTVEHSNLRKVYVCLVGFDFEALQNKIQEHEFKELYEVVAKECYERMTKKISEDSILCRKNFYFFFIPFSSVEKFKSEFHKGLGR